MKYFKIKNNDGRTEVIEAMNSLAVIKKYDLATIDHINTQIIELSSEQEAIAISYKGYEQKRV